MALKKLGFMAALATFLAAGVTGAATAEELSLSYFMGPKHPMNAAVFTPFAEKLAEVSGGELTVKQFPAGALNSAPPKQYSTLLSGISDVAFGLPGYTGKLFPVTNTVTVPGVCPDAFACTQSLWNAMSEIETEFNAKILAIWANDVPVLLTKDKPVRTMADLQGMKVRVTSSQDLPFIEALGATPVSQPVTVINQNLANGTIDAIAIDPSAIGSFKLHEAAKFVTIGIPGSGSAFFLLMNNEVYNGLSDQQRGWVDEASGKWLSDSGGSAYLKAAQRGIKIARDAGLEIIELDEAERAAMADAMSGALADFAASELRDGLTGGDIMTMMAGG
ncbi:MAG: TRAP transporter substrate-binding protein [Alphaproteobacteria bacterium]